MSKMKTVKAWCVKNSGTGFLCLGTISETEFWAMKKLTDAFSDKSWDDFKKDGYKVVPVKITEVTEHE